MSLKLAFKGKMALLFFIIFSLLLGYELNGQKIEQKEPLPKLTAETDYLGIAGQEVFVRRVIDGDTIELESGERVRYVGIDTPESVDPRKKVECFGKEAASENKKLVEGKRVLLVKDVSETDRFGRLLRYIYLRLDNGEVLFVNDYLVRTGHGKALYYPPDTKFIKQLEEAEKEAREENRGLWLECGV